MVGNVRTDNKCIFCKYWLGKEGDVNYIDGSCKYSKCEGMCAKDKTDTYHSSESLCHRFERRLSYV